VIEQSEIDAEIAEQKERANGDHQQRRNNPVAIPAGGPVFVN
jgi:hypothetical protein